MLCSGADAADSSSCFLSSSNLALSCSLASLSHPILVKPVPAGTGLTKIDWDKEAREQDKARLEELKKQELESATEATEQQA